MGSFGIIELLDHISHVWECSYIMHYSFLDPFSTQFSTYFLLPEILHRLFCKYLPRLSNREVLLEVFFPCSLHEVIIPH